VIRGCTFFLIAVSFTGKLILLSKHDVFCFHNAPFVVLNIAPAAIMPTLLLNDAALIKYRAISGWLFNHHIPVAMLDFVRLKLILKS